jgi:hypothetical protein
VADGFQRGRALAGVFTRALPVGNRVLRQTCLSVVVRQQFGLGGGDLGKAPLQHRSNALMVLLPRALEQRLIRRILDQGVLKTVGRLWRQPLLIQELRRHQLVQPLL